MRPTAKLFTVPAVLTLITSAGMAAGGGQCSANLLTGATIDSACDTSAPSILLTVVNRDGNVVPRAKIGIRRDGGAEIFAICTGEEPCEDFVLLSDLLGRFDVEIAAPGYHIVSRTINVGASGDGCSPQTEDLIVVLDLDETVGALAGAWRSVNQAGMIDVLFNDSGEIVGAIEYNQQTTGDGNLYVSFNNRLIRGAAGQEIFYTVSDEPIRSGDRFTWSTTTLSRPIGFEDASMSEDFTTLVGSLADTPVLYTRLDEIPAALQDASQTP